MIIQILNSKVITRLCALVLFTPIFRATASMCLVKIFLPIVAPRNDIPLEIAVTYLVEN